MDKITEDVAIEVDGKIVNLCSGDLIAVVSSDEYHIIDENVVLVLNGEECVLESGDILTLDDNGAYFVTEEAEIPTIGGRYVLEAGDRLAINEAVASKKTVALAMQMKRNIMYAMQAIIKRAKMSENEEVYQQIVDSQSWHNLRDLIDAKNAQDMESRIVSHGVDPVEDMEAIVSALRNGGETRVAKYLETKFPLGRIGKITKWLGKLVNGPSTKELSTAKVKYEPSDGKDDSGSTNVSGAATTNKAVANKAIVIDKINELVELVGGKDELKKILETL